MAITITVNNDANHTISISKPTIARQAEYGEVVTVTGAGLSGNYAAGRLAYVYFYDGNGTAYAITNNGNGFDYSTGSFTFTIGAEDSMLKEDGDIGIQIVLRAGTSPSITYEWRSKIIPCYVERSILGAVDAVTGAIDTIGFNMFPAKYVSIDDLAGRYAATNAENALAEIAGAGRTTETVKNVYDYAVGVNEDFLDHASDSSIHFTSSERSKLAGIEAGAEVNNISDINATDLTDGGDTELHKHDSRYYTKTEIETTLGNYLESSDIGVTVQGYNANTVVDSAYVHTDNNYTTAEKNKLAGIQSGAQVNNISDVNATDLTDGGDTALHSHDGRYYTESEVNTLLSGKSNTDHLHTGVYEPADSTILKEIDIGISIQPYDLNTVVDSAYVHTDNNFTDAYETAVDNSVTHISDVVRHNNYGVGSGTDDYVVALSPVPSSYTAGMVVSFKASAGNTGAATLNCNGLGAKAIKKDVTGALEAGDIKSSQIVTVIYDGTNFQIVSGSGGGGGGAPAQIVPLYARYTSVSETATIAVPVSGFTPADDLLNVYVNSTFILGEDNDYTLTGLDIVKTSGTWEVGTVFDFVVYKNVLETTDNLTYIGFATLAGYAVTEGQVAWNATEGTLDAGLTGNAVLQIGQEIMYRVFNNSASLIPDGSVVYTHGVHGDQIDIRLAIADGTIPSEKFLGVVTADIPSMSLGYVTWFGKVRDIAGTYPIGTTLYASDTVAGALTNVKPIAPHLKLPIAYVIRQNGSVMTIVVRMNQGSTLGGTDDNVEITTPTNNQLLVYNDTSGVWENKSRTYSDFGAEPANANIQTHISSTSNPHNVTYSQVGAAAASHAHGNITTDGKIGSTANLVVKTTTDGVVTTLASGTTDQYLRGDGTWGTPAGGAPTDSPTFTGTVTLPATNNYSTSTTTYEKVGHSTMTGTSLTITDAFITASTYVSILPMGTKSGVWAVNSNAGNFVLTSTVSEAGTVFKWIAVK